MKATIFDGNTGWLCSELCRQTDSVLTTIRKVIKANLNDTVFPFKHIVKEFQNNPAKNYKLDDDYIDGVLHARYWDNDAFYILSLIYSNLDYYNQDFHKDHLHPKSFFENESNLQNTFSKDDYDFCANPENWDSILNLQLLNGAANQSKNAKSLESWVSMNNIENKALFVDDNISLKITDFRSFIENRHSNLKKILINML